MGGLVIEAEPRVSGRSQFEQMKIGKVESCLYIFCFLNAWAKQRALTLEIDVSQALAVFY